MDYSPVPNEDVEVIDQLLTESIGMHGSWVFAIERYDENGEPILMVCNSLSGTGWQKLGMAEALILDLKYPFTQREEEDE